MKGYLIFKRINDTIYWKRSLERQYYTWECGWGSPILSDAINNFNSSTRPKKQNKKEENSLKHHRLGELLCGRQWVINAFESRFSVFKPNLVSITLMPASPTIP